MRDEGEEVEEKRKKDLRREVKRVYNSLH